MCGGFNMIESRMHGKVLNVRGGECRDGAPIILWHKESGPPANELWRLDYVHGDCFCIVSALAPNMVLDVEGGSNAPGAKLILYNRSYPPAPNQLFRWTGDQIESCVAHGLVLDVDGANTSNGARLILWDRGYGKANQSWRLA